MAVIKDLNSDTYLYCFQHGGKTFAKNSFKNERDCEEAELQAQVAVGKISEFDYVRQTLYESANRIDMMFPSLSQRLRRSYEILTKEMFVSNTNRNFLL